LLPFFIDGQQENQQSLKTEGVVRARKVLTQPAVNKLRRQEKEESHKNTPNLPETSCNGTKTDTRGESLFENINDGRKSQR